MLWWVETGSGVWFCIDAWSKSRLEMIGRLISVVYTRFSRLGKRDTFFSANDRNESMLRIMIMQKAQQWHAFRFRTKPDMVWKSPSPLQSLNPRERLEPKKLNVVERISLTQLLVCQQALLVGPVSRRSRSFLYVRHNCKSLVNIHDPRKETT